MAEADLEQDIRHMFDQPAPRLEPDRGAFAARGGRRFGRSGWLRPASSEA